MKKQIRAAFALIASVLLTLSVHAAGVVPGKMEMTLDLPAQFAGAVVVEIEDFDSAAAHTTTVREQFVYTYMKATSPDPHITLSFTVKESGVYDFAVEVMAYTGAIPRSGLVQIDSGDKVYMSTLHGDRTLVPEYFTGLRAALTAGEHKIHFYLGDDFDDVSMKSLFLDKFHYIKTAELPDAETPAAAQTAVSPGETETAKTSAASPSTGDTAAFLTASLSAVALVMIIAKVSKKSVVK